MLFVVIFDFVFVVDADDGTCKGSYFAEGDKEGVVDLSAGIDGGSPKEENQSTDGEEGGGEELYEVVVVHRRCCWRRILSGKMDEAIIPPRRRPLLPFRREDVPGAKVW